MKYAIILAALAVSPLAAADPIAPGELVGGQYNSSTITLADGRKLTLQLDANGNLKTTQGASGASQPVVPGATTPAAPDISTVTTGGTAVTAFAATHCARGCIIINPKGATIDLCVNGVGATASGTTTAGALICIPPGQQYGFTARATAISVVSSDSSHPFGGEGYQ